MKKHIVVRYIAKILIPFIQLYSFYVIAHGDLGPGGGFQAGAIFSASIILFVIVFGLKEAKQRLSQVINDMLGSIGVLVYAVIGLLCIVAGGMFLEYSKLPLGSQGLANHLGIYGIELGIGITVATALITIFFETAGRKDD